MATSCSGMPLLRRELLQLIDEELVKPLNSLGWYEQFLPNFKIKTPQSRITLCEAFKLVECNVAIACVAIATLEEQKEESDKNSFGHKQSGHVMVSSV